MMGGTRKQVKARRRAITKLINSASTKSGTTDGNAASAPSKVGTSLPCCGGTDVTVAANPGRNCTDPIRHPCLTCTLPGASDWKFDTAKWSMESGGGSFPAAEKNSRLESTESATKVTRSGDCVVCGVSSTSSCSACGKVFYCGKIHQKKHWNEGHKSECYPYEEMSPEEQKDLIGPLGKGPYIKASKDLQPMEKIYEDYPLMTGPGCCADLAYEPVCLGCTNPVSESQKCSECRWPLCGPACGKDTLHDKYECEIFAKNNVQELKDPFQYELVRILRCLLTKHKDPDVFEQLLMLYGAVEHRRVFDCLIEATYTACKFVRQNCNLSEFDRETINYICGVVDLQTQPSGKHRSSMQIFSFPTKLTHDCAANTRFIEIVKPNGENLLQVVAIRSIKRGEPLTQRLLISLEPTYERQKFLLEHYYFQCKCSLCMDPQERKTFFSAVKCTACADNGVANESTGDGQHLHYVLPLTPTNLNSQWVCNFCKSEFSSEIMLDKLDVCEQKYWKFKYGTLVGMEEEEKIVAIRKKIAEFETELHPNNFFVWKLKQLLFNKLTEHILLMLPPSTWKKFREIYSEIEELACCVMTTVHILQPGLTLIRGRSLHDLVAAYWGYIQWAVLYGKASSFKTHQNAEEFYSLVSSVCTIFEPEVTDIRRVIDSVVFMRDHVHEIRLRMQRLGRVIKKEKHFYYTDELKN